METFLSSRFSGEADWQLLFVEERLESDSTAHHVRLKQKITDIVNKYRNKQLSQSSTLHFFRRLTQKTAVLDHCLSRTVEL